MRIVVSGTHASGKSTLISDFAGRHPDFEVFGDVYELLDDAPDEPDAATFAAQFVISAERLEDHDGGQLVVERGPLDFLAYLEALERLGRPTRGGTPTQRLLDRAAAAMAGVDVVAVLPLNDRDLIEVSADEDLELRVAMNDALLDYVDTDLIGAASVVEITGDPSDRVAALEAAIAHLW
jgi:AAA domain